MPGPEPDKRVRAPKQGSGCNVFIPKALLEEMGVDPDHPYIEVSRYAYRSEDRNEMRLRFYEVDK